jgi:hypothetical protein
MEICFTFLSNELVSECLKNALFSVPCNIWEHFAKLGGLLHALQGALYEYGGVMDLLLYVKYSAQHA